MSRTQRARTITAICAAASLILLCPHGAFAQARFEWPEKAKNLKVLPKKTSKEELSAAMIGFTRSLGVRCPFCHVGQEGQPLTTFDFASDEKPTKNAARGMLRMVRDINGDLKKIKVPEPDHVEVTCVTCHHGRPRPMTLAQELSAVYQKAGVDSAVAAYRTLRGRYYGTAAFDFSERSLGELSGDLMKSGHKEDAIKILLLNVEQNPQSSFAYSTLADAYADTGQKDLAIQSYKKAIELDPTNRGAEQRLRQLSGEGK
jgi:tetratricopeptide (TPR) repeat protein